MFFERLAKQHFPACPQCGSDDAGPIAIEAGALGQFLTIRCHGCRHEWEVRVPRLAPTRDDNAPPIER